MIYQFPSQLRHRRPLQLPPPNTRLEAHSEPHVRSQGRRVRLSYLPLARIASRLCAGEQTIREWSVLPHQ